MKPVITLHKCEEAKCWLATHPPDQLVAGTDITISELFETNVLPTAFTLDADEETVRFRIQQLNPDCDVVIRYISSEFSTDNSLSSPTTHSSTVTESGSLE